MRSLRDAGRSGKAESVTHTLKDEVGEVAAKYAEKNEEELMQALMQSVAAAKADGTFSPEQLESFAAFVSSSLDEPSRKRLMQLVKMVEGG